jgi:hypothetical protein
MATRAHLGDEAAVLGRGGDPRGVLADIDVADGRVVTGSPGHPRAGAGTLGDIRQGDMLDGARVARVTRVPLDSDRTWDILPSGPAGYYVIDGVVLRTSFER